jgi:hypothetical protein
LEVKIQICLNVQFKKVINYLNQFRETRLYFSHWKAGKAIVYLDQWEDNES